MKPASLRLRDLALLDAAGRWIADPDRRVAIADLARATSLAGPVEGLRGRSVLIATLRQLPAALAAVELDGVARRILLCPPDVAPAYLPGILADGQIDAMVTDGGLELPDLPNVMCRDSLAGVAGAFEVGAFDTEWVLLTSGTSGRPKLVRHDLRSLTGPIEDGGAIQPGVVWSTFYDMRRYGGLTILLRALLGGSLALSSPEESAGAFLQRLARCGVSHVSGTPSHWRRALMSPDFSRLAPSYIRLSGEVADQAILDRLRAAAPGARIVHAFASTEAGVVFEVHDGRSGFPASQVDRCEPGMARLRVVEGTLRVKSGRTAACYLGGTDRTLRDADGWVDTGDIVVRAGDRYGFAGRREGVINVGGQKVHPEEVEAVINRHPAVCMSRVWARRNPMTGALVAADIMLHDGAADFAVTRGQILDACRLALPAYKVPASLRQVASLAIAASGKLVRGHG